MLMEDNIENNIETLDYYVRNALDFIEEQGELENELPESPHTLVVGSQSGLLAGRIVYRFSKRSFSHAKEVLVQCEIEAKKNIIEDVTIVSATGSRQTIPIARYALEKGLRVNAILCNDNSELNKYCNGEIITYPSIEEPPTVNTATYGMMIQAITNEDISKIRQVIESTQEPEGGYEDFKAFTVIVTDSMPEVAEMIDWKLRGEKIGRCIGTMATYLTNFMHGAAVTDASKEKELYIALGLTEEEKKVFEQVLEPVPKERKHYINVPKEFGALGFMMLGYSIVGLIQKNYPDFQKNISRGYKERASKWKWLPPLR